MDVASIIARIVNENNAKKKGWAKGKRAEIMDSWLPSYADALAKGWVWERDCWDRVCRQYHFQIHWTTPSGVDPEGELPVYDENKVPINDDDDLTEEQYAVKRAYIDSENKVCTKLLLLLVTRSRQAIRRYMKYNVKKMVKKTFKSARRFSGPYDKLLLELTGVKTKPPRRRTIAQQMWKDHDVKTRKNFQNRKVVFEAGGNVFNDRKHGAAMRQEAATDEWNQLTEEEKLKVLDNAVVEGKRAREEWERAMLAPPSREPAVIQECVVLIL
jgi:hypothetical protein